MKEYSTAAIRNVALVGHSSSGKTSLAEAMLFNTGATTRLGKVEDGTTVSDFEEEEIRRRISLSTAIIPCEYQDVKINLLDTPGYTDFMGEVKSALRVADAVIVVVDSVAGVEVGTELVWQYADERRLPRFVVISKMDRENANFSSALESVQTLSKGARLVPVQLPLGEKQNFKGVIGLLSMQARLDAGAERAEIPAEMQAAADEARVRMVEAAAEGDDALLEKYLSGEDLTPDEVKRGFHKAVLSGSLVPVFVASGTVNIGILPLLDGIVRYFPNPAEAAPETAEGSAGEEMLTASDAGPLAAFVFKTTADPFVGKLTYFRVMSGCLTSDTRVWNQNRRVEERLGTLHFMRGKEQIAAPKLHAGDLGTVAKLTATTTGDTLCDKGHPLMLRPASYPTTLLSVALAPKTQADSTKMGSTLTRLCEEDPTLHWRQDPVTKQTVLAGMGDQHVDVALRRAETRFGTGLTIEPLRIPYRETITKTNHAQYRHKKQTGGAGQFGEVHMRIEPLRDAEYEFLDEVVGQNLSHSYMGPIEKGIRSVLESGVMAGYPVVNVRVAVYDGKEHPVDSKPIAFEIAGREAFKLAVQGAGPVIQEPIMKVRVVAPEANMGDVLGDLNTRRARVQGMEQDGGKSIITAEVPQAEMTRYATDLRSITGGRGVYTMEFSHYEIVPAHTQQQIIADAKKARTGTADEE